MAISLAPLSYGLGVEVLGVDLSQPLSDVLFDQVNQAFLDHDGLLLLRNQNVSREHHIAFSRRFGELDRHDALPLDRHPDYPELFVVANERSEMGLKRGGDIGQVWHSDLAPSLRPAANSLLRALHVPSSGGDTMFTNMYAAYEALSDGMKSLIANLNLVHVRERKNVSAEWAAENRKINPPVAQPLVRVHAKTGRKSLFLCEGVRNIEGMTVRESRPIIDFLIAHSTRPQFGYRHRWRANDIIMWDNRCTMHLALGDHDPAELRHLERTTVLGEPSGRICEFVD